VEDLERAKALCPAVSRETWQRIGTYVDLLAQWQKTLNLVSTRTLDEVWTRHVADSLQLLALAPGALRWADLGAGAGLPGLPLALALADVPGAMVDLVESDQRKAAFLREVVRLTGAPARIHPVRIERWAKAWDEPVEVVTARALAPLDRLIPLALPLLQAGALGLFPKGRSVAQELTDAARSWHITHTLVPSATDSAARIVVVTAAAPRGPAASDRGGPPS